MHSASHIPLTGLGHGRQKEGELAENNCCHWSESDSRPSKKATVRSLCLIGGGMMAKRLVDPRSNDVSSQYNQVLPQVAINRLRGSWQQLFRTAILELMPAEELGQHFHPDIGRPTKELYSVAGLILIKEFMDWTDETAADRYSFDVSIQYALNLPPLQQAMCERTLERYLKLFCQD